ncbi:MAG: peptidylprolyl isomerase [Spongiibacteraceae bacterium]
MKSLHLAGALTLLVTQLAATPLAIAQTDEPAPATAAIVNTGAQTLDRVVAIVDDDVILYSELQGAVLRASANLRRSGRELPPDDQLRRQVFDQLVLESLQLQMADRAGARINDTELNEAMERIARQNGATLEQFSQSLNSEGVTYAQARERIRREMLLQRVQQGNVNQRVQITDQEIENFLDSAQGQSLTSPQFHLKHALVSLPADTDSAARADAKQKAGELLKRLNNGESFERLIAGRADVQGGDLGWRRSEDLPSLLAPAVANLREGQAAGLESASGFHVIQLVELRGKGEVIQQTKARHILLKASAIRTEEQTEQLANELRNRIQAGAAFTELARQYSEDIGSAMEGGELGWTSPGQLVDAFQTAMDSTPKGAIGAPFRSRYGWHVLQVEDRRQQDVTDEMRRTMARNYLHQRKFQEELDGWLRKIRDEAYVDIKKM